MEFDLKSIADAGLVGLPNAGKSTILSKITSALPKIAAYPFTTLNPYIGTIEFPDYYRMTIADIPGIIKGASNNAGLGHSFLRHIERSKILVIVIDVSGNEPWNDLATILNELELYQKGLSLRKCVVLANKAEVGDEEISKRKLKRLAESGHVVVPISAKEEINILMAMDVIRDTLKAFE